VLVTAVAVVMGGKTFPLAWWTLLALSLPLVATLQFYLGYPLRLATTALCPWLLKLGGWTVLAQGTTLRWAGETVVVDAPCSGIQMLWTGCFLAAVLACHEKLNTHETWRLFQRTSLSIFVANVVRASVIFCLEAGLWHGPAWAHEGVGLALFAVAAVTILLHSRRLARAQAENIAGADLSPIEQPRASS
jgi:exosortase/archaeosortase family protein